MCLNLFEFCTLFFFLFFSHYCLTSCLFNLWTVIGELSRIFPIFNISTLTWTWRLRLEGSFRVTIFLQLILIYCLHKLGLDSVFQPLLTVVVCASSVQERYIFCLTHCRSYFSVCIYLQGHAGFWGWPLWDDKMFILLFDV
jgi:hypothetical protein